MPLTLDDAAVSETRIECAKDRPPPVYPGLGGLGVVPNGPVLRAEEG